jgi:hypothetical protein
MARSSLPPCRRPPRATPRRRLRQENSPDLTGGQALDGGELLAAHAGHRLAAAVAAQAVGGVGGQSCKSAWGVPARLLTLRGHSDLPLEIRGPSAALAGHQRRDPDGHRAPARADEAVATTHGEQVTGLDAETSRAAPEPAGMHGPLPTARHRRLKGYRPFDEAGSEGFGRWRILTSVHLISPSAATAAPSASPARPLAGSTPAVISGCISSRLRVRPPFAIHFIGDSSLCPVIFPSGAGRRAFWGCSCLAPPPSRFRAMCRPIPFLPGDQPRFRPRRHP